MKKILTGLVFLSLFRMAPAQTIDTAKATPSVAAPFASAAPAPDSVKPSSPVLGISGYVDVYYKYNFNQNVTDNKTSFTNSNNSFELNMASIKFQETYKNAGFVADLGFGNRAQEFSYNDTGTKVAIKQLNVYYAFNNYFKLSLGAFETHMGYESLDPNGNRNYSMSYQFTYGAFFNTGLKADFTLSSRWTAMLGIFDPNDHKSSSYTSYKFIGAQLVYSSTSTKFKGYFNYLEGKDTLNTQNSQYNLILQYQPNAKFYLVASEYLTTFGFAGGNSGEWNSTALYGTYDFTSLFGLTLRAEYFSDPDGLTVFTNPKTFPTGGSITSFTLSGNFRIGSLTVIPEFRMDEGNQPIFSSVSKNPTNSTSNVLLAAYYAF